MRLIYNGPAPERVLWGRAFPRGQVVALSASDFDRQLAAKALRLDGFAVADDAPRKRGRPRKVKPDGEDQS